MEPFKEQINDQEIEKELKKSIHSGKTRKDIQENPSARDNRTPEKAENKKTKTRIKEVVDEEVPEWRHSAPKAKIVTERVSQKEQEMPFMDVPKCF